MFIETKEGQTHAVCEEQLKKYGGNAKCCLCNKHDGCDLANSKGMFSPHEMTKAIKHAMKVSKKEQDEVLGCVESDEAVIVMSAVRYMLGRASYGVGSVCGYLIKHQKRLSRSNKEVVCRDILEYINEHPDMKYKENWAEIVTRFTEK